MSLIPTWPLTAAAAALGLVIGGGLAGGLQQIRVANTQRDLAREQKTSGELRLAVVTAQGNANSAAELARAGAEREAQNEIRDANKAASDARAARGDQRLCAAPAAAAGGEGRGSAARTGDGDGGASADGRERRPDVILALLAEQWAARADRYGVDVRACQRLEPGLRDAVKELQP